MPFSEGLTLYQVDAFAHGKGAFTGNPAAVCLVPSDVNATLTDDMRQAIAAEMNLSETAFVEVPSPRLCSLFGISRRACSRHQLRWFTPACEVPLCGHATLAAAAALLEGERNICQRLYFETLSGELSVARLPPPAGAPATAASSSAGAGGPQSIELSMDLPLVEGSREVPEGMDADSELVKAVVGDLAVEEVLYAPALRYLLIVVKPGFQVTQRFRELAPNFQRLQDAHTGGKLVGVIVTVQGGGEHDLLSRFFAPWAGINEDPVTGSAHSVLGPYWAARLKKTQLRARQSSRRGGELRLTVDTAAGRVQVAGRAVIVLKGRLMLPKA